MYLFKILSVDNSNSSSNLKSQGKTNVITLFVLSAVSSFFVALVVLLFSLAAKEFQYIFYNGSGKTFNALPQTNYNLLHPETQQLILRKSDLEVPCEFFIIFFFFLVL